MSPDPDTLKRIRAQADVYADEHSDAVRLSYKSPHDALIDALRAAYLRGADAGYSACVAERRKP